MDCWREFEIVLVGTELNETVIETFGDIDTDSWMMYKVDGWTAFNYRWFNKLF